MDPELPNASDVFREFLEARGKRLTQARALLVPFDADEIADRLRDRPNGEGASRATVYRALLQLVEAGLIHRSTRESGSERFEHRLGADQNLS